MSGSLDWLIDEPDRVRDKLVNSLSELERAEFRYHWGNFARDTQLAPPGDWRIWFIIAGRGFGKTRAGAEWVRSVAESDPNARIALLSASIAEARSVMVEGESGILACFAPEKRPIFEPSLRRLKFSNGAQAQLYSAAEPEALRGPQHSHAWCDEIGKWPIANQRATRVWDNLLMGLRVGSCPKIAATSTPRSVPLVKRLMKLGESGEAVITKGSTYDNAANLPEKFLEAIENEFSGSTLARQEIGGELLTDIEGALWTRGLLENARETESEFEYERIVVAVDPPVSAHGDECGIIVAAKSSDGIARVIADCSIARAHPNEWARTVARAAEYWEADRVVAESNQGGEMVKSVLFAANSALPVKLVHASRGKVARAEPIAALYSAGRVRHLGNFPRLEDQLCGLVLGGEYVGPGRSPDRADALVWAIHELMLGKTNPPSVRPI